MSAATTGNGSREGRKGLMSRVSGAAVKASNRRVYEIRACGLESAA